MEEYRKKWSECYAMESLKTNLRSLKMLDYSLCSILEQNPKKEHISCAFIFQNW